MKISIEIARLVFNDKMNFEYRRVSKPQLNQRKDVGAKVAIVDGVFLNSITSA